MKPLAALLLLGLAAPADGTSVAARPAGCLPPLPDTVRSTLGPVEVRHVEALRVGDRPAIGAFDGGLRLIYVKRGLHPAQAWQTLEHERIHLELWDAGATLADSDVEDRVADAIGAARVREMLAKCATGL
jgi:hypothetical protein